MSPLARYGRRLRLRLAAEGAGRWIFYASLAAAALAFAGLRAPHAALLLGAAAAVGAWHGTATAPSISHLACRLDRRHRLHGLLASAAEPFAPSPMLPLVQTRAAAWLATGPLGPRVAWPRAPEARLGPLAAALALGLTALSPSPPAGAPPPDPAPLVKLTSDLPEPLRTQARQTLARTAEARQAADVAELARLALAYLREHGATLGAGELHAVRAFLDATTATAGAAAGAGAGTPPILVGALPAADLLAERFESEPRGLHARSGSGAPGEAPSGSVPAAPPSPASPGPSASDPPWWPASYDPIVHRYFGATR